MSSKKAKQAGAIWTYRGSKGLGRKGPKGSTNAGGRTQSVHKIKKVDIRAGNKVLRKVKTGKPVRVGSKRIGLVKR